MDDAEVLDYFKQMTKELAPYRNKYVKYYTRHSSQIPADSPYKVVWMLIESLKGRQDHFVNLLR